MRESNSKSTRRYESTKQEDLPNTVMQLELIALREKNLNLAKMNTKLLQEVVDLKNKLQLSVAENLQIYLENKNLSRIVANISQTTRSCLPNLLDFVNAILHVTEGSHSTKAKNPSCEAATPNKTITHTVKPHTVNGTVLNLMPVISLTRLNNNRSESQKNISSPNLNPAGFEEASEINIGDTVTEQDKSFVRSRRTNSSNANLDQTDDENDEAADFTVMEEELEVRQLTPISEVSQTLEISTNNSEIDVSKVIGQFPRNRDSSSSTDPQVNEMSIDLQTTMVDSPNTDKLKKQHVFLPRSNSTRIDFDELLVGSSRPVSPINPASKISQATDAVHGICEDFMISRIPTPSASAMGDLTGNGDSNRRNADENISTPILSSPSRPRHSCRRYQLSTLDSTARLSRDSKKRDHSLTPLSPIIILEKIDTNLEINATHSNHLSSVKRSFPRKDNEGKSVKRKRKNHSQKSKLSDENEDGDGDGDHYMVHRRSLEKKIQEMEQRLTAYSTNSSQTLSKSPVKKRPSRAAKPKFLQDASLKKKLRRS